MAVAGVSLFDIGHVRKKKRNGKGRPRFLFLRKPPPLANERGREREKKG